MITKKICMLGSFAVGKTSLVRRFVDSIFDEKYQTTVGVKVDKKQLTVDGHTLKMMLWDLAGEDEYNRLQQTFLRGSSGFLLVADGTRSATLEKSLELHERIRDDFDGVPFILLLNKVDLKTDWQITQEKMELLTERGYHVFLTSAKTGEQVEPVFERLGRLMLGLEPKK